MGANHIGAFGAFGAYRGVGLVGAGRAERPFTALGARWRDGRSAEREQQLASRLQPGIAEGASYFYPIFSVRRTSGAPA